MLWAVAVLGLLMAGVLSGVRIENRQSHNGLQRSKALIAAESGIALAVKNLLSDSGAFIADGREHRYDLDGIRLTFSARSEHGKLDLNFCQLNHFSSLLRFKGATQHEAASLSDQLSQRRIEGKPLGHLEELLDATSMNVDLYERILPFVTLWSGRGVPDAAFAAEPLLQALQNQIPHGAMSNAGSVIDIESSAELSNGFKAGLSATIALSRGAGGSSLYNVYRWQERQ
ncbi:type II secretion system protein GspK [Pseudomonas sp. ABY48]|uniref:type II secretion system protein GspK n=1 Tax=Pseudomonas sp. ABY48 TaxID=3402865 RepID=UPI003B4287CC